MRKTAIRIAALMSGGGNREAWLSQLVTLLRPDFGAAGLEIPQRVRCSCSFPFMEGPVTIGQAFWGPSTLDGIPHVLVSPLLSDPISVAATVIHELIHVAVPTPHHHDDFADLATYLGLVPPLDCAIASPDLEHRLDRLIQTRLGPYPHSPIVLEDAAATTNSACRSGSARGFHAQCNRAVTEEVANE